MKFQSVKKPEKYPCKLWTAFEILRKSIRKKYFIPVEKNRKPATRCFHGLLSFLRKKKCKTITEYCALTDLQSSKIPL